MPATDPYHCAAWPRIRRAVLERDNYICRINRPGCTHTATHCDHIIPWDEGGPWLDPDNLRAACHHCNTGRATARRAAMARLNIHQPTNPPREW